MCGYGKKKEAWNGIISVQLIICVAILTYIYGYNAMLLSLHSYPLLYGDKVLVPPHIIVGSSNVDPKVDLSDF